jgi:NADH-quinone oxidoreductase subunit E
MSVSSLAPASAAATGSPVPAAMEHEAEKIMDRYPASRRSAAMPLLYLWQERFGFISNQGMHWVAAKVGVAPIAILEIVTFYPMFKQHAVGKFHFMVCRTLSCALVGSAELRDKLVRRLGIPGLDDHGYGASPDGRYSVEFVECLAACGFGPVLMVNDETYEKVDDAKLDHLLQKCA